MRNQLEIDANNVRKLTASVGPDSSPLEPEAMEGPSLATRDAARKFVGRPGDLPQAEHLNLTGARPAAATLRKPNKQDRPL